MCRCGSGGQGVVQLILMLILVLILKGMIVRMVVVEEIVMGGLKMTMMEVVLVKYDDTSSSPSSASHPLSSLHYKYYVATLYHPH